MLIAETKHVESALDVFLEVKVTDAFQEGGEEFVALSHSTAQALVVGIEVVEESLHVILARSADGAVLDGTEVIAEGGVQLSYCCQVGVSSFVGEISSGVITVVFNLLILGLAGNTGVAAYGVVANTSLVAVALFNGIAQGSQPLISESYSKGNHKNVTTYLKMAVTTTIGVAILLVVCIYLYAPAITAVFNGEGNQVLASYAENGLRLYFIGFLFAGMNIVGTAILSSIESAKYAFFASISRGFVAIIIFAFVLSALLGLNGVWLAFPATEFVTMLITLYGLVKAIRKCNYSEPRQFS